MFGLSSLLNTEQITRDTIQSALEKVSAELNCSHKNFFLMIKPTNEKFDMVFYIYRLQSGSAPTCVREITLKEILNSD